VGQGSITGVDELCSEFGTGLTPRRILRGSLTHAKHPTNNDERASTRIDYVRGQNGPRVRVTCFPSDPILNKFSLEFLLSSTQCYLTVT